MTFECVSLYLDAFSTDGDDGKGYPHDLVVPGFDEESNPLAFLTSTGRQGSPPPRTPRLKNRRAAASTVADDGWPG